MRLFIISFVFIFSPIFSYAKETAGSGVQGVKTSGSGVQGITDTQ